MLSLSVVIVIVVAGLVGYALALPFELVFAITAVVVGLDLLRHYLYFLCTKRWPRNFLFPDKRLLYRKLLRSLLVLTVLTMGKTLWMWIMLVPARGFDDPAEKADLLARRNYLLHAVANTRFGPADLPAYLPEIMRREWTIATLSMTTAALTNLAYEYPETRTEAIRAIRGMINRMLAKDLRDFEYYYWKEDSLTSLAGSNGHAGYLGHLNWMLSAYRLLGGGDEFSQLNREISDALARRIAESPSHYIETFPGHVFVPDTAAVVASLSLTGQLENDRYRDAIQKWIDYTRTHLVEPTSGVIYPWVSAQGRGYGPPRGSYASWNGFFLPWIDPNFAQEQYIALRKHFVTELPGGAAALREYLPNVRASGDIDSGPVIFGLSTSGSGFMLSSAKRNSDWALYSGLLTTAEGAGFSWSSSAGKRYLLAPIIGDAIVLAMRTSRDWDRRFVGVSAIE